MPKYYIENNHPAIIPREMFHRVQEEIARRKSKRPTTQKTPKRTVGNLAANMPYRKDWYAETVAAITAG